MTTTNPFVGQKKLPTVAATLEAHELTPSCHCPHVRIGLQACPNPAQAHCRLHQCNDASGYVSLLCWPCLNGARGEIARCILKAKLRGAVFHCTNCYYPIRRIEDFIWNVEGL